MAWKAIDRNQPTADADATPLLGEALREKIRSFFPRYETKRAALLPALHVVQDALGSISWQAAKEIADVLEIHPSDVIDTLSFYTHFWTHPKGEKVIMVCRSLTCEVMGGVSVLDELKRQLGIGEHETTPDGKYSLVTEECLAGCDHGPCMLVGERMYKCVKPQDIAGILADAENDKIEFERSELFDAPAAANVSGDTGNTESVLESKSDVGEVRDAE